MSVEPGTNGGRIAELEREKADLESESDRWSGEAFESSRRAEAAETALAEVERRLHLEREVRRQAESRIASLAGCLLAIGVKADAWFDSRAVEISRMVEAAGVGGHGQNDGLAVNRPAPPGSCNLSLFCDLTTDEQRAEFFESGRAVETGICAPAIAPIIARAFREGRRMDWLQDRFADTDDDFIRLTLTMVRGERVREHIDAAITAGKEDAR